MEAKAKGDMSRAEEEHLKLTLQVSRLQHGAVSNEVGKAAALLEEFESSFIKITEATGVTDVNEIIQKFSSQKDTRQNLNKLSQDNERKLKELHEARDGIAERVEHLKYSTDQGGAASGTGIRNLIDKKEDAVTTAGVQLERARAKFEKANMVLVEGTTGIQHLATKLQSVPGFSIVEVTQENVVDAMTACERLLLSLKSEAAESKEAAIPSTPRDRVGLEQVESGMKEHRPFNRRIPLSRKGGRDEVDMDMDVDVGLDEVRAGRGCQRGWLVPGSSPVTAPPHPTPP